MKNLILFILMLRPHECLMLVLRILKWKILTQKVSGSLGQISKLVLNIVVVDWTKHL